MTRSRAIEHRSGMIEDYVVWGVRYNEDGATAWHLTLVSHGSNRHLWLYGGKISDVAVNTHLHETGFLIGDIAVDLNPATRTALLDLVAGWERDPKPLDRPRPAQQNASADKGLPEPTRLG